MIILKSVQDYVNLNLDCFEGLIRQSSIECGRILLKLEERLTFLKASKADKLHMKP